MTPNTPLSAKRERQLIEQVRGGDRGALGELLGAHHRQVYHVCLRMVSNASDAAELAQDVLLKAVQHIDAFKANSRFGTWLVRIAMNLSISHLRKRKVRQAASLDAAVGGAEADGPEQNLGRTIADRREPAAFDRVEHNEQIDRVLAAMGRLDEGLKSVILLRDLQEMDYHEIAEVLGVPLGTVKSRLFRARLALRQELAKAEIQGQNTDG
jgi:RNA polymerase sigma-70 factor (ECF subfamily)